MPDVQNLHPHSPPPTIAQRLGAVALITLGLSAATAAQAAIGSYGSAETSVSLYVDGSPPQIQRQLDDWGSYYNLAPPGTVYRADAESRVSGNSALSFASADLGMLKVSAAANFGPRFIPGITGNSLARSNASFSDEWLVQGAGLAAGTPVTLMFTLHINGVHNAGSMVYGTSQRVGAVVTLNANDGTAGGSDTFNWGIDQATGDYLWAYDTAIGRKVALMAGLSAIASVDQYSSVGSMYADFGHTFNLYAAPSLAGVSTVSLGGHDYALPAVPEPASWLLMACGGLALALKRRVRQ